MKIRKLHLKNIGPFDDAELEFLPGPAGLAEIHIFTGQNGSGKTTLLTMLSGVFCNLVSETQSEFGSLKKRFRFFEYDGSEDFIFNQEDCFKSQAKIYLNENDKVKIVANPTWWNSIINEVTSSQVIKDYRPLTTMSGIPDVALSFAAFAFSGYRQIQSERVEAIYEPKGFNPLAQSLDFVKDYSRQANQISINQLIANNISKRALSKEDGEAKEAERYATVLAKIEKAIFDITGEEIRFKLKRSPIDLVVSLNGIELEFDVLPDGLRSLISWIADLLGRVDLLKWNNDLPITDKKLILLLDEIEVHLHPAWQRKVLPVVQKLFKNAQIFVSTHSPFVVNSVDDAWVYDLEIGEKGKAHFAQRTKSSTSQSIETVLRKIFDVDEKFGLATQDKLEDFYRQKDAILRKEKVNRAAFLKLAEELALKGAENGDSLLRSMILSELRQLNRITGSNEFEI